MTDSIILELGRNAVEITLMLSLPLLGVSLIVGLVIGILQAVTQIHEPTVSFVPKLLALFATMALCGPWMLQNMVRFTAGLLERLPELAR